jgi:pullulanase/glycogen debranching enzyme
VIDDDLLVLLNAHHEAIEFTLPGEGWAAALDTAADQPAAVSGKYPLQGRSFAVLTRAAQR